MRQLTAHAFIQLPILDDDGVATLIQKLKAQAAAEDAVVPPAAQEPLHDMVKAGEVIAGAGAEPGPTEGGSAHTAHLTAQRTWSTLAQWLGAFNLLDDHEDARVPAAKKLYAELFGEGLGFANAKAEVEWLASEKKIKAIGKEHLTEQFEALGGKVFWTRVVAAHKVEGVAAHLTVATTVATGPSRHEAAQAAQESIKEYVAAVIGSVRAKKPATQAAADQLLLPLATWESAPRTAAAAAPTPPTAPTTPVVPQA